MKNNRKHPMELLAPAGAMEQLIAAVQCGADAVYLGGAALNARRGAGNFAGNALREAVEYCHVRGVKVHLTLNTIVLERELEEALALAREAYALGVDAVIVQDLGLARLLKSELPKLVLHASTQMAVHNLSGVRQLEELGFARVVLAREMSRAEIARVAAGTTLETEVFVHGALCMCVSGQCYFSSVVGERSGNRGLCAQPCRLPFSVDEPGHYGLSLKDLSLVEQLADLCELGVTAVKIEGRMKRPEYVAAAVTACQMALNGEKPDLEQLRAVFSRSGFTQSYYNGQLGAALFGTRQKEDVVSASAVFGELAKLYQKEHALVELRARFVLCAGEPARLQLEDDDGNRVAVTGAVPEGAINKPTTRELIVQSLEKLGGTPYALRNCDVVCGEGLMLPVSKLNVMRREAIEALTLLRAAAGRARGQTAQSCGGRDEEGARSQGVHCGENGNKPLDLQCPVASCAAPVSAARAKDGLAAGTARWRMRFEGLAQIPEGAVSEADEILLPVAEAERVEGAALLQKLAVELPRIAFDDYDKLRPALERLREKGVTRASAGNLGGIWLAKQLGFTVLGDWALNLTNTAALNACAALGCADATLSFELNLADAKRLGGDLPRGLLIYGHLPLMIVRCCPAKQERDCAACGGLTRMRDRLGNSFYVSCHGTRGVTEIYNHLPLYLADRQAELDGFDFLTLCFTVESRAECERVLQDYRLRQKRQHFTRGLYYRNIL